MNFLSVSLTLSYNKIYGKQLFSLSLIEIDREMETIEIAYSLIRDRESRWLI